MNNHRKRLNILVALSDKLWEDYSQDMSEEAEKEYLRKMYLVKKEINNGFLKSMQDLKIFSSELGYLILENPTKTFLGGSEIIITNRN
ncbi:hypothetical protein SD427_18680 (plasmid) [Chryseobacterium sp. JJR-5R]|uniref:hypothetical protein n=1 Tax=Chryseobacterium sp. JJR-5R TaxID=3093923 RepID=UPI002A765B69|nr:hypothetical protein [Chryseobacterium sp. JJR-5R]WPO84625.1 hypothetical protein SD427_18680 [Chryseobacterium sp. JJR-5R]